MNEWDRLRRAAAMNKERYPPGTRIELIHMGEDDPNPIPDGTSGYGIRIYCTAGELKETYASLQAPLTPEQDISIGTTELFRPEFSEEGLLRVTTDAGSIYINLRSEGSERPS